LTNSTDADLRICVDEFEPKLHGTSILSKAQILDQAQTSLKAKKANLAATQEEEKQPMRMKLHQSKAISSRPIKRKRED